MRPSPLSREDRENPDEGRKTMREKTMRAGSRRRNAQKRAERRRQRAAALRETTKVTLIKCLDPNEQSATVRVIVTKDDDRMRITASAKGHGRDVLTVRTDENEGDRLVYLDELRMGWVVRVLEAMGLLRFTGTIYPKGDSLLTLFEVDPSIIPDGKARATA
jgi:hypothetical protein